MAQCEGTSKKTGERCTAPVMKNGVLCAGHAGVGIAALDPADGARAKAKAMREKAETRKRSALDWAAYYLEKNGEMLAKALVAAVERGDWRAAQFMYERVYGKPTERVETDTRVSVDDMTAKQREALRAEIVTAYPELAKRLRGDGLQPEPLQ